MKNFLKKILPFPEKTFNGEMQQLYDLIIKERKRTDRVIADLQKEKDVLAKLLSSRQAEMEKINEILCNTQEAVKKANEVIWGQIFNNTITESKWLVDKTFSPPSRRADGRQAISFYMCCTELLMK